MQSPEMRRGVRRYTAYLYMAPFLLLFGVFLVGPLLYGLCLSFSRWELLTRIPPHLIGLGNYAEAFHDAYFRQALLTTILFVLLITPSTIALSLALAVGLHKIKGRRQELYRAMIFLPTLINVSVAALVWRWFYNDEFGLFNAALAHIGIQVPWLTQTGWAMVSIAIMTLWWTVGGPTVILLAGIQQIPPQYHEAALLDGAVGMRTFRSITLPLLRPVLLFVVILNIIGVFQIFGQTFLITGGGPENTTRTLSQYIYTTAFNNYRMGYASALSWLLFVVIAFCSFVQFRLMKEK